jgi:hypothetical protein
LLMGVAHLKCPSNGAHFIVSTENISATSSGELSVFASQSTLMAV